MRIDVKVFRDNGECPEDYFISPCGNNCDIFITYDDYKTIEGKLNDVSAMTSAISRSALAPFSESDEQFLKYLDNHVGKIYDRVCGIHFYDNALFQAAIEREPSLKNKEVYLYDSLIYFPKQKDSTQVRKNK